ncbi:MAG TPA: DnaJ domain-containing protein [Enhygromyxa sp.]|nr:DnaJ domain-containing protein [Enhygromyxa sp.]
MSHTKNHYELLGVTPTATADEIRRAYRRRIAEVHPDKPGGDETLARALDEARTVLLDPLARARYDASQAGNDLIDEAMDALSEVGGRAIDRLSVTLQARGHDLLGALRTKAADAIRKRRST